MKKIFAHGATEPVVFEWSKEKNEVFVGAKLFFGSTIMGEDYPVHFYGIKNIKALHKWLGEKIDEFENK